MTWLWYRSSRFTEEETKVKRPCHLPSSWVVSSGAGIGFWVLASGRSARLRIWWKWCYHALSHCAEQTSGERSWRHQVQALVWERMPGVETGHCKGKVCRKHLQLILSFTLHMAEIFLVCDRVYADFNPHIFPNHSAAAFCLFYPLSRIFPVERFLKSHLPSLKMKSVI